VLFSSLAEKARSLCWTKKGSREHEDEAAESVVEHHGEEQQDEHQNVEANLESVLATDALQKLRECSAVAALHPDQAAEPAIALALKLRKPFAVVPCCVYSALFPRRRLPSGSPVRTYEDLLDYLQGMDSRIRREQLNFEGKATILYMTPDDVAHDDDTCLPKVAGHSVKHDAADGECYHGATALVDCGGVSTVQSKGTCSQ